MESLREKLDMYARYDDVQLINVIDLESTCWEKPEDAHGQEPEIIEIGFCQIDIQKMVPMRHNSILVQPVASFVSDFCTNLTTLTQERLDKEGVSFDAACRTLEELTQARKWPWASWGNYDLKMFMHQCDRFHVQYPFHATHYNIKNLFAVARQATREVGLKKAIEQMGWQMEGTHHRGEDDAHNAARIGMWLFSKMQGRTPIL